jgi:hypothetical protein
MARGVANKLSEAERDAVRFELRWAWRPLQLVLKDLAIWSNGSGKPTT